MKKLITLSLFPFLFLTCSLQLTCISICKAQVTITGVLISKSENTAIERASVYISGTTNGVYSSKDGSFTLCNVKTPCQLVVSHLGYELKVVDLKDEKQSHFVFKLTPKEQHLKEVSVVSKSRREENVKAFKRAFLGADNWGTKARLLNDSDLVFEREEDTIFVSTKTNEAHTSDNQLAYSKKHISTFKVKARAPLLVDLPLLGYTLSVDLKHFTETSVDLKTYCSILGYFLFKPYAVSSSSKQSTYERNRRKVYYNSPMHLFRSIYAHKLRENGYVVFNTRMFDPDSMLVHTANDKAIISHQKDAEYRIYYLGYSNGNPIDMSKEKIKLQARFGIYLGKYASRLEVQKASWVKFNTDHCILTKSGMVEDNSVLFRGFMGTKKVGSMLPEDYEPAE